MKLFSVINLIMAILLVSCQKEDQPFEDGGIFIHKLFWKEIPEPIVSEEKDPFNDGTTKVLFKGEKRSLLPKSFSVNDLIFGVLVPEPPWCVEIEYFALEKEGKIRCIVGVEKSKGCSDIGIFQFDITNNNIELGDHFYVHDEKWSYYLKSL